MKTRSFKHSLMSIKSIGKLTIERDWAVGKAKHTPKMQAFFGDPVYELGLIK
jgi:hypothetical protein